MYSKKWYIKLDTQKQYDNEFIHMIKQDIYSNELYITLVNNGKLMEFGDATHISIVVDKADKSKVVGSGKIVKDGLIKYTVDYQAISSIGIATMTLKVHGIDSVLSTSSFNLKVIEDPYAGTDGSIGSTSQYPLLQDLINKHTIYVAAENSRATAEGLRVIAETDRVNKEKSRVTAEGNRASNEDIRLLNEVARIEDEGDRNTNEAARKVAETDRVDAEVIREANKEDISLKEAARVVNETERLESEVTRKSNEIIRNDDEVIRKSNENERVNKELIRIDNEGTRIASEGDRTASEGDRKVVEAARVVNEDTRKANEVTRGNNEDDRKVSEVARVTAEDTRKANEDSRVAAEISRENNYTEKIDAFVAETERVESEYPVRLTGIEDDLTAYKEDNMPHQITNLQTGKIYKYGFQLSAEGNPQIIYRED